MDAHLSAFVSQFSSSASLRGMLLAGTAFLAAKAMMTASAAKGYRKKLPSRPKTKKANKAAPTTAASSSSSSSSAAASSSNGLDDDSLLKDLTFNEAEFVELLRSFIAHTESLQNNPPKLIPREDLIVDLLCKFLDPFKDVLEIRRVTYVQGRSNLIVKYHGAQGKDTKRVVSFVGAHMDVVTANPKEFKRPPFELQVEGDMLYGRGVTDCLGHVALIACIFKQLAIIKPKLKVGVAAVFIANEENSTIPGVGIDALAAHKELDFARHAPLFWIDSANIGPTVGTGGVVTWAMKAVGFSGHSGVPQNAVNALSLGMEAIRYIQQRFYQDFPFSAEASQWLYSNGSSLKPTRIEMPEGGVTNIPREVTFQGDIRFLPFFPWATIKAAVEGYVAELNDRVIRNGGLPHTGGVDRFVIQDPKAKAAAASSGAEVPMLQGVIEWTWKGEPMTGLACDMDSVGYKALSDSIFEVTGDCKPFALTGSLPIIADLQEQGYDVQVTGFGAFDAYHAADEYAKISGFKKGHNILTHLIDHLNAHLPAE